jgi:hypothetical protein
MREKGLMEEDWNNRSNWRKKIIKVKQARYRPGVAQRFPGK